MACWLVNRIDWAVMLIMEGMLADKPSEDNVAAVKVMVHWQDIIWVVTVDTVGSIEEELDSQVFVKSIGCIDLKSDLYSLEVYLSTFTTGLGKVDDQLRVHQFQ